MDFSHDDFRWLIIFKMTLAVQCREIEMKLNTFKIIFLSGCLSFPVFSYAAPVIEQRNLSTSSGSTVDPALQQQQSTQFWELRQSIQELQNQVRQLRGIIEQQDNTIQQLNSDLKNRYTDLDQRLEVLNQKVDPESAENHTDETAPEKENSTSSTASASNAVPATPTSSPASANNPTATSTAPAPSSTSTPVEQQPALTDEQAYQQAYNAYQEGGASQAITPMNDFIKKYPNSPYVSHAYYWLGEFHLSTKPANYNQAKENFEIVAGNYPKSGKAPAALLRLSEIAKNIDKDIPKAREYYLRLIQNYSGTPEAQKAKTSIDL